MRKILLALSVFAFTLNAIAQDNPWQQQADYQMNVTMDVKNFQYKGTQLPRYPPRGILPPLFQRLSAK